MLLNRGPWYLPVKNRLPTEILGTTLFFLYFQKFKWRDRNAGWIALGGKAKGEGISVT